MPQEQEANHYQTISLDFHYFYARKVMFVKYAIAFICFPGGYGTLDEFFETLTLIQTLKIEAFPIILFGSHYWTGLVDWMREHAHRRISSTAKTCDIFRIVDSPKDARAAGEARAARSTGGSRSNANEARNGRNRSTSAGANRVQRKARDTDSAERRQKAREATVSRRNTDSDPKTCRRADERRRPRYALRECNQTTCNDTSELELTFAKLRWRSVRNRGLVNIPALPALGPCVCDGSVRFV